MKHAISTYHQWDFRSRALLRNPILSFLVVFIGLPSATLLGVAAAVYAVMLPVGLLMGWF